MEDTSVTSAIALGTGVALLLAAAVASLLRQTRGEPTPRRVRHMASLARAAAISVLPAKGIVVSFAAAVFAFLESLLVGLSVTILIVRAIPPQVPHPTEAHEGFADSIMVIGYFSIGAVVSLCIAMVVGVYVGAAVEERYFPNEPPA